MDAKWKSTMGMVMGVLAIPLAGLLVYGMYIVMTYKPPPKPFLPKIDTFRADGKPKDSEDPKTKKAAKKTGEPQVWDVELIWEVENTDDITIDNGVGKVEPKGTKHVEIDKDTTFIMKAKNSTGEVTYKLDVQVTPVPAQDD
ncbi:MAG TPA: hypothetical protein VGL53_15215 [Bryobacteraceae bacterium]|jgi:hypothetical protein